MSGHSVEEIQREKKKYLMVFGALAVLTVATVGASTLELGASMGLALGLAIALVKGTLVAAIFMHLSNERTTVYWILLLTVVFFAALMILPIWTRAASTAGGV